LSVLHTCRHYSQEIFLVPISVRGWVDTRAVVLLEGLYELKIPRTRFNAVPPKIAQYKEQQCSLTAF